MDELWKEYEIPAASLPEWIDSSARSGIYEPGNSDLFIRDERTTAQLCHESDIHIRSADLEVIRRCVERWLAMGYSLHRSDDVGPQNVIWREVHSIEAAVAGIP
jgi:hypothetical protein